ncbi:EAL domain-containing protein [Pleomorphochaeta sp. DL1XJH-081]|uniref:EAL domain-containing protein n=1 Tax=Pleomorphochaeta sp. DL1XJH-081 TaxID=3409690 RepID=UPI003BB65241
MGDMNKLWLRLGFCALIVLLFSLWQELFPIAVVTAVCLASCLIGICFSQDEDRMFDHNSSFKTWLLSHEKRLPLHGLDSYFCLFIQSLPKGLHHAIMDHRLLDELYASMMRELGVFLGSSHVKRLSREQFVIIKEFPSPENLDFNQRYLYQLEMTSRITNILDDLIASSDVQVGRSIEISVGCASGGIRYRIERIEDLLELSYFTMKLAREEDRMSLIADEHIRARKYDIDECKAGFNRKGWEHEFNPFFQPIIDPASFRIVGLESLARWQLGGFRVMPAGVFKDLAYEIGCLGRIDATIIEKTFSTVRTLYDEGLLPYGFRIVFNVSASSLNAYSAEWLGNMAAGFGLHPEHIELDIKDSILSDPIVAKAIDALKAYGFRIALDAFDEKSFDIRTFFNSCFDIIKLDYSHSGDDSKVFQDQQRRVFNSLTFLGDSLSMQVLAKNIETKEQLECARQQGAHYLQGNYFTPPVPETEFRNFLKKYREGLYLDAYVGASELA